ncbi:MAG: hypothetical protein CSA34_07490 [Desulfobulbus propionicus]|nr:MAG: hypothetical protein CSA34_07490 [Desulfobulbus propionicus]
MKKNNNLNNAPSPEEILQLFFGDLFPLSSVAMKGLYYAEMAQDMEIISKKHKQACSRELPAYRVKF